MDYFTSWEFIGGLWYWVILGNFLLKPLGLAINERDRLFDPLALIVLGLYVLVCFGLDSIMYEDDGTDIMTWRWYVMGFAFVWWSMLRFTDEDYDIEKGVDRAFRMAKKCPRCMNELPSMATSKCPHCTSDLG